MAGIGCVIVAAAIFWYNYLVVVNGDKQRTAKEPQLSSILVTFALMRLINDNGLFDKKPVDVPPFVKWIIELAVSVFFLDVGMYSWKVLDDFVLAILTIPLAVTGVLTNETFYKYDASISSTLAFIFLASVILKKKLQRNKPQNISVILDPDEMEEIPEPPQPQPCRVTPRKVPMQKTN
ncbi:hypothetical protein KR026_009760 [Drosophila bipectinata]|nr:hypothetical protein KR026_009760 [Drosophila bipectinata]